jgi:hypothetical protein
MAITILKRSTILEEATIMGLFMLLGGQLTSSKAKIMF